jgi:hypothetical protein
MKKFLAKICLFAIVSTMLSIGLSSAALASSKVQVTDKEVTENKWGIHCIDINDPNIKEKQDVGYLYTIIEEPLDIKDQGKTGPDGDSFVYRSCFRNTYKWVIKSADGKVQDSGFIPLLLKTCNSKIANEIKGKTETAVKSDPSDEDTPDEHKVSAGDVEHSCKQVQVILSTGGTAHIAAYVSMIYKWAGGLVGLVAVIVIIISGMQLSLSGGEPDVINKAKTRIIQSISGIALLFLSALILYTINPTFFTV